MRIHEATASIRTRRRFVVGAAAAVGTAILAACSGDTGPTPTTAPTIAASPTPAASISSPVTSGSTAPSRGTTAVGSAVTGSAIVSRTAGSASAAAGGTVAGAASVRVVHASPDAPAVDVYTDGTKVITALAFGSASNYSPITSGRHDFQVYATGADPNRDQPVIDGRGTSIPADARLSIIALGLLANIKGLLADDRTPAPASGKAKVKLIHAAPGAPMVDIAVKGGRLLFANTEFGKAYPYQEVDAKTYDLDVRAAGKSDVVLAVPGVTLGTGAAYSLYAVGLVNGTPKLTTVLFVDNR